MKIACSMDRLTNKEEARCKYVLANKKTPQANLKQKEVIV